MIVFLLLVSLTVLAVYVRLAPTCHLVFAGVISDLPKGTGISRKVPAPRLFFTPNGKRFTRKDRFTGVAHGSSMEAYGIPNGAEFYGAVIPKCLGRPERIALLRSLSDPIIVIEPAPTDEYPADPKQSVKRLRCVSDVDDDGAVSFYPYFDGRKHTVRDVDDVVCVVEHVAD